MQSFHVQVQVFSNVGSVCGGICQGRCKANVELVVMCRPLLNQICIQCLESFIHSCGQYVCLGGNPAFAGRKSKGDKLLEGMLLRLNAVNFGNRKSTRLKSSHI